MSQSLLIGVPTVINQNIIYALPTRVVSVNTSAPCDVSIDGTSWSALVNGSNTSANKIRCTTTSPTVTCKAVGTSSSGGSGGGALPTAPIGQVLISQGDGIAPIFSNKPILSNPAGPIDQRSWSIWVDNGGDLIFRNLDDAGGNRTPNVSIDPYNGGLASPYGDVQGGKSIAGTFINFNFGGSTLAQANGSGAASTIGNIINITDSTTNTPGAVVVGGGTFNVLARWNGTNWKVVA